MRQEIERVVDFSSLPRNTVYTPSSHLDYFDQFLPIPRDHDYMYIFCAHCGEGKKFVENCGDRLCPYCRRKSVRKTLAKKGMVGSQLPNIRFMTLTLKPIPDLTRERVDEVRGYFRKLIRLKTWKRYVHGGLYVIEVTQTEKGYHYHFHVLYQGKYFPFLELRRIWKKVTNGSYIVWIKRCRDLKKSMDYLLYYISKIEKGNIPESDFVKAFKGIKLIQFFGIWCRLKGCVEKALCKLCGSTDWISWFDYMSPKGWHDGWWEYDSVSPPVEVIDFEQLTLDWKEV